MDQKDWEQVWAAIDELWLEGISIARVPNAAPGYEWMAFATAGTGHDLLGKHKAHCVTLPGLLNKLDDFAK